MRLKIEEFNTFAKSRGYKNPVRLIEDMGCSKRTYGYFIYGGNISSDLVAELYSRWADEIFSFIDFGDKKRKRKKPKQKYGVGERY